MVPFWSLRCYFVPNAGTLRFCFNILLWVVLFATVPFWSLNFCFGHYTAVIDGRFDRYVSTLVFILSAFYCRFDFILPFWSLRCRFWLLRCRFWSLSRRFLVPTLPFLDVTLLLLVVTLPFWSQYCRFWSLSRRFWSKHCRFLVITLPF